MDRRKFVKAGAILGAAASLPRFSMAQVKTSNKIKVGLIGCGGRGTGAVADSFAANPDYELVAIADLFQDKIDSFPARLDGMIKKSRAEYGAKPEQANVKQRFVGFDAYKKLCETDVDVVIEATPPAFRPNHAEAIIDAGKHAFLEKPAGVDATQMHQMMRVAQKADQKKLSVVCGTQRHYNKGYQEAMERMKNGDIGEIVALYCYWNSAGYVGQPQLDNAPQFIKDLPVDSMEYQIRNWFSFIWASGDHIVEQHVHNLDVILWGFDYKRMPVEVSGMGGRGTDLPTPKYGNRFSHFAIDYDMGDGLRLSSYCRQEPGTTSFVGERFVGTKGILETHEGGNQVIKGAKAWESGNIPLPSLVEEHRFLADSIRAGTPVNTLHNLIKSTTVGIAGRMSAFSGKRFKYDWVMAKSQENLVPSPMEFRVNAISPVPVPGKYPLV